MKQIPLGLRDYLPNDIKQRDHLIQQMKLVVEEYGLSKNYYTLN